MDQSTSPLTPEPTRLDRTGLVDWTDPPFRGRVSPGPLSPGLRSAGEVEARALAVRWLSRRRWQWGDARKVEGVCLPDSPHGSDSRVLSPVLG